MVWTIRIMRVLAIFFFFTFRITYNATNQTSMFAAGPAVNIYSIEHHSFVIRGYYIIADKIIGKCLRPYQYNENQEWAGMQRG